MTKNEFNLLTAIKIRKPFIFLVTISFIIIFRALLSSEAWLIFWAWIQFADFIPDAFTDTKCSFILGSWIITFSTSHRNTTTTWTWTFTIFSPVAPLAIDRRRLIFNWHTFLILAPLKPNVRILIRGTWIYQRWISYFVSATVCSTGSRTQLCNTFIIDQTP